MAVFKCSECGITVSKDVVELQDRGLMDETLPSYRIRKAYDGEDLVPEGFFLRAEGEDSLNFFDGREKCFCLNLNDTVNTELDYENFVGCCGPDEQDLGLLNKTIVKSADAVENESRNSFIRVFSFLIMILSVGLSYLVDYGKKILRKF